ncbi:MAG TPA: hypothetical protein VEY09_09995 [Pyrinomonadaceae bacterium]|nr:hypothetical protein [Pyrinomonadaceae bacterium]
MNRLNPSRAARRWRALALLAALALLSQPAAHAARAGTETDAPATRAAGYDSLLESLVGYFFGPAPSGQPAAAQQPAQPQAAPSPTPAATPAQQGTPGTNAPAGEGDAAPERKTVKDLKYPLPPWRPLGAAGPESTVETLDSVDEEFVPLPDRWRFPWPPSYDRYDPKKNTPWVAGSTFDPYNQNVLKADYPIAGNHTFLNLNLQSQSTLNPRTVAVGGRRDQFFINQNFIAGLEIFKGTGAFEPKRWAFRVTTVTNFNFLANNTFNPFDARRGNSRLAVEEAFFEKRLLVHSPNFDFVSVRVGMQNLTTDFRGFLFSENQLGVRLFGNANANRDQYNLAFFSMRQRDDTSQLHSFDNRRQIVFAANWFRQDFLKKGYTVLFNFHQNADRGRQFGDRAALDVSYLGFHGDGKLGKLNVSHAFYQAFGRDRQNRLTGRRESINGQMGAFEAALDRDWVRWRGSFFFASGDGDAADGRARGFDVIQDNPNFGGGPFMFWTQQATAIGGRVGTLKNKFSLIPTLRNKFDQRANFVNPGVLLWNFGADLRVTPKLRMTTNASYIRFAQTGALEQLTGRPALDAGVGTDLSVGAKFRPFLNENLFIVPGVSVMFPHGGYAQLIGSRRPLVSPTFAFQLAF